MIAILYYMHITRHSTILCTNIFGGDFPGDPGETGEKGNQGRPGIGDPGQPGLPGKDIINN